MTDDEKELIEIVRRRPDLIGDLIKLALAVKRSGVPPQTGCGTN